MIGEMRLLLSCISTHHSALKKHWSKTASNEGSKAKQREEISCPLTMIGSYKKPDGDLGGQLCLLDRQGNCQRTLNLSLAAGMVGTDGGVLVTAFNSIHLFDPERVSLDLDVISLPVFNALHSISRTRHGYLVASTGLDLLVEFDREGNLLWQWWATDHEFDRTLAGEVRSLDKEADHRLIKYGTLEQTTHVNSVIEWSDGRVLATLFHQGTVIAIDRESGKWQTVLAGLDHPHALRVVDEHHFTVADTIHGWGLLARLEHGEQTAFIEEVVDAGTTWLQDCSYHPQHDTWILVDGKASRVSLRSGRAGEKSSAQFSFDPEWRLYEAYAI
jgi:hypothetical protein